MNLMGILQNMISHGNPSQPKKQSLVKTRINKTLRTLNIKGYSIIVQIISSSRTKRIRLSHSPGHMIRISTPINLSESTISMYIRQHEDWIVQQHLLKSDSIIDANPDLCDHSREHYATHKQSALVFCTRKVEQRNQSLGWNYHNITVKSLKTKRGSCSSKGNLNFNYKLMFLPEAMADYIIIHELCHLQEMNHGPRFWKLVEQIFGPDWKKWRKIK